MFCLLFPLLYWRWVPLGILVMLDIVLIILDIIVIYYHISS
jgi:hypothetical protein